MSVLQRLIQQAARTAKLPMNDQKLTDLSNLSLMEHVIDEFQAQLPQGKQPSVDSIVKQHPQIADELRPMLETLRAVDRLQPNLQDDITSAIEPSASHSDRPETFPNIDDYELLRIAGRGGMGVVYEARQVSLSRPVALKVLPTQLVHNRQAVERFQREARSAAQLHHAHIVPIYEVGNQGDVHFYAMQFIDGDSLSEVISQLRALREQPAVESNKNLPAWDEPTLASGNAATNRDTNPAARIQGPLSVNVVLARKHIGECLISLKEFLAKRRKSCVWISSSRKFMEPNNGLPPAFCDCWVLPLPRKTNWTKPKSNSRKPNKSSSKRKTYPPRHIGKNLKATIVANSPISIYLAAKLRKPNSGKSRISQ